MSLLEAPPPKSPGLSRRRLCVPRERICYISWTIDAYEGLGFLVTDEAGTGTVSLYYPAGFECEVNALLEVFIEEGIPIRAIEADIVPDAPEVGLEETE